MNTKTAKTEKYYNQYGFSKKVVDDAQESLIDYLIGAAEEIRDIAEEAEIDHLEVQLGEHLPANWLETHDVSDWSLFTAAVCHLTEHTEDTNPNDPAASENNILDLYRAGPVWVVETIRGSLAVGEDLANEELAAEDD
jgi:hypothetical protein